MNSSWQTHTINKLTLHKRKHRLLSGNESSYCVCVCVFSQMTAYREEHVSHCTVNYSMGCAAVTKFPLELFQGGGCFTSQHNEDH